MGSRKTIVFHYRSHTKDRNATIESTINNFKSSGYSTSRRYYSGAKLVDFSSITFLLEHRMSDMHGHTIKYNEPLTSIRLYTYTYPKYKNSFVARDVADSAGDSSFYDNEIDEKLGGEAQLLGV